MKKWSSHASNVIDGVRMPSTTGDGVGVRMHENACEGISENAALILDC